MAERNLIDLDGKRSRSPFKHRGYELSSLREDQVPRFFAALTDPDINTVEEDVPLADLHAMQNRVDTAKVEAMAAMTSFDGPLPVVVLLSHDHFDGLNGKAHFIADGHHRLAAAWLRGDETAKVRVKDLREPSNAMKEDAGQGFAKSVEASFVKADDEHGLVLGWAIVSTEDGQPYFDVQGDHIPVASMLEATVDFAKGDRTMDLQHSGIKSGAAPNRHGTVSFLMPMSQEIAKAFGMTTTKEGLMIGVMPDDPAVLEDFRSGKLTGFSIGGTRLVDEEVE